MISDDTSGPPTLSLDAPDRKACQSCGSASQERYCPRCGQRELRGRHTLRGFGRGALTHIIGEEGLVRTAVQLTIGPGRVIRDYLAGRTVRFVSPVGYLVVTAAAFTFIGRAIGGSTGASEAERAGAILIIPFVALASRLLNWRGPYNLAEHLIMVTYLSAQVLALLTVLYFGLLVLPAPSERAYAAAATGLAAAFYVWGYSRSFERRRLLAGVAGILSLVLGSTVWLAILMVLVGLLRR